MNRGRRSAVGWSGFVVAGWLCVASSAAYAQPDGSDITVELTTDQSAYPLGEPVTVTVTKCNPTDATIVLPHNCVCCHDELAALDGSGGEVSELQSGCILIIYALTLDPGECESQDFTWNQSAPLFDGGEQVPAGSYRLRHTWTFPTFTTVTESEPIVLGTVVAVPSLSRRGNLAMGLLLALLAIGWLVRRR